MKPPLTSVALTAALFAISQSTTAGPPLAVGVAEVDVTPPIGYRMAGYFSERRSTGAHDPLFAKALVLQQGDVRGALVFCDLVGVGPSVSAAARRQAEERTGIPAVNILIAATHAHTGPLYWGALRDYFHEQAIRTSGTDPSEPIDYGACLADQIVAAIEAADGNLAPAELSAGFADQHGLSFNRRFHMRDGTVRFNPGRLNPDIVRVAGPIDPEVGLVRFDSGGDPLACLTVFALHLDTVGGTEYSGDYPYYLAQHLRERFGDDFVSLFGAGTCGDINHIDVSQNLPQKGQVEAERIGSQLAETVVARLDSLEAVTTPSLKIARQIVAVPLQSFPPRRVEQARADLAKIGTREASFLEQVETYKIVAVAARQSEVIPLEVQAFRLADDVALVGLPGEVFVDLGLDVKRRSPFATTIVIELANDAPGYLPTRRAFAEGSYETVNSRIAPGGAEQMVDAAVEVLQSLREATP